MNAHVKNRFLSWSSFKREIERWRERGRGRDTGVRVLDLSIDEE